MFTGIVEETGTIVALMPTTGGRRMRIETALAGLAVGDSIAVNGICLTVVSTTDSSFEVEAVPETLARTNLGELAKGHRVDLERPLSAAGRFDGHIVQGHVDGTGRVEDVTAEGEGVRMRISAPASLLRYTVEKGSIAVDGVSLTIAAVDDTSFAVALIPHTLAATVLGERRPGDLVNLEVDVLAKYVERMLEGRR